MTDAIKGAAHAIATHPTVAAYTSGITIVTGLASWLDGIQGVLAIIASTAGIVLSIVLSISHWRKGILERRLLTIQIEAEERG
jgi:hypothetical protein